MSAVSTLYVSRTAALLFWYRHRYQYPSMREVIEDIDAYLADRQHNIVISNTGYDDDTLERL